MIGKILISFIFVVVIMAVAFRVPMIRTWITGA